MKKFLFSVILAGLMITLSNCKQETNPLLMKWKTPFGVPPFEQVLPEHYMPAFIEAMAQHNAEIDKIVNNKATPNFKNTILAFDNSGELLTKVGIVFGSHAGVKTNDEIMGIARELSPLRSKHFNEINLNEGLFARVKAVYEKRNDSGLDEDQVRLVEEIYKDFERSGANLPSDKKEELKALNTKIADLQLRFGQNLVKETAAFTLVIDNEKDLAGLGESQISAAASRAAAKGMEGKWIFGLDNPSIIPFLQFSSNPTLREKMLKGYLNRCNNNNSEDNKEIIKELVSCRLQKANLLGYTTFADYVLEDRMAGTPQAVYELLDQLWTPALNSAKNELKDMSEIAKKEGNKKTLEASDWRYYFEKALSNKFQISEDQLRPYFKIENVRDGIFYVANRLYGITFTQINNVPLPHPEAIAFECKEADGTHIGLLFMDMFARPGEKSGGAWCSSYREQGYKNGKRIAPLVTIVGNFTRPVGDKPALLSSDEVNTFFHEFGHALHGLFQDVKYYGISNVKRDFVELPSQIMEHWAFEPEVLNVYAKHYETGEVIPAELVDKLDKSGKYGQGFATVEYLAASYLDMDYHVLSTIPADLDVLAFEAKVLSDRGLINQIPPRYRSTYFSHTMGGGYTAGYYSYIWAEVLDCDAYQAFVETGDIFNQEVAHKFRYEILSRGGEKDNMELYLNFRGKKPEIAPLLKNRGLE